MPRPPAATGLPARSPPRAFPVPPLGPWRWEASNAKETLHSNRPGQPPRNRVSGPKGATPRNLSRYAPHIHVPQGVLPLNRDHFHPRPRADPVTGQATRGQPSIRAWCQHLGRSFRYGTRPVPPISMRRRRSSDETPTAGACRDPPRSIQPDLQKDKT